MNQVISGYADPQGDMSAFKGRTLSVRTCMATYIGVLVYDDDDQLVLSDWRAVAAFEDKEGVASKDGTGNLILRRDSLVTVALLGDIVSEVPEYTPLKKGEYLSRYVGQSIMICAARYHYRGLVHRVDEETITLVDSALVYVTGDMTRSEPLEEDPIDGELVLVLDALEAVYQPPSVFAPVKKRRQEEEYSG